MANAFDQFDAPVKGNPFDRFDENKSYVGSVLPMSKDAQGKVHFDPNAGILGALKSAVTLPHDVYQGTVDPKSDEGISRAFGLATLASPVNPAVRAGDAAIPGTMSAAKRQHVPPPIATDLYSASDAGYTNARGMGVVYDSNAIKTLADKERAALEKDGFRDHLAPKTFKILDELGNPPPNSVAALDDIEAARRSFRNAARDFNNPTDQEAASRIIDAISGFMSKPDPSDVVDGPAVSAGKIISDARGNYAAAKRSDAINGIEETAELRAAAANSGQNLDNAIRQRAVSLLQNKKAIAGFSPEERAAIEAVARGGAPSNTLRFVGNLLGGGGGLGAVVSGMAGGAAGGAFGGPMGAIAGAAVPAIGFAAKKIANALTRRRLNMADETVRTRSPLHQEQLNNAPYVLENSASRSALNRALLEAISKRQQNQQPQGITPEISQWLYDNGGT